MTSGAIGAAGTVEIAAKIAATANIIVFMARHLKEQQ